MKRTLRKIFIITGWLIIASILGFLIFNFVKHKKDLLCRDLVINMDSTCSYNFVNEAQIYKLVTDSAGFLIGKPIDKINLRLIKNALEHNPYLKNIIVYKTLHGDVKVDISERQPLVYVLSKNNERFYIDNEGILFPACSTYTPNVVVAIGDIYEKYDEKLDLKNPASINNYPVLYKIFIIAEFIAKSDFWRAMTDQIFINYRKEIELIPKTGKHKIIIGNIDNLDRKFEELLIFYKRVIMKIGWDAYESIDIRFNNQIVCTIKNTQ